MLSGRCVCVKKHVGGGLWDFMRKPLTHNTQKYNLALEEACWDRWAAPITPSYLTHPTTHTDNYINFQPPHAHMHAWPRMTNPNKLCLRGKMEESRGGADKLETTGKGWVEDTREKGRKIGWKNDFVIIWMIYGDPRQFWGNAIMRVFPSEGFFQQIRSLPGDFQNKWWRDWVTRAQNWGNHYAQTNTYVMCYSLLQSCD